MYVFASCFSRRHEKRVPPLDCHQIRSIGRNELCRLVVEHPLVFVGLLAYEISLRASDQTEKAWICLSAIFVAFSIDEIANIHERIGSVAILAPIAVVLVLIAFFSLRKIFSRTDGKITAILIFIAFVLYSFVGFQEALEKTLNWQDWAAGARTVFEEGTELFGTFIALVGVMSYPAWNPKRKLKDALPRTSTLRGAFFVFLAFFVGHFFVCMTTSYWERLPRSGNPFVWFPAITYFTIGLYYLKRYFEINAEKNRSLILSFVFLILSTIMPFVFVCHRILSQSSTESIFGNRFIISFATAFYGIQLILCGLFLIRERSWWANKYPLIGGIIVGTLWCIADSRNLMFVLIVMGVNSLCFYFLTVFFDQAEG